MAAKKQTKSKTRTSSKKQGFQFKWWMGLIFVAVVAIVGLVVLRFSRASGIIYQGHINLQGQVGPGQNGRVTYTIPVRSFQLGHLDARVANANFCARINNQTDQVVQTTDSANSSSGYIPPGVQCLKMTVTDLNQSQANVVWELSNAGQGDLVVTDVVVHIDVIETVGSGGNNGNTGSQPVRLGSCGQPLPQGESGNTPQKCPGQQVNQPGGQPYIYYNFDVPGGKQRVDTTCGYRNAGGYAVVCPNDFGGKNNSKSWQYVGWIGNDSWRQMGVGNERDIGAFKKGGLCGVKSSLQLGLGWLGDNNTALYLVPCDQLQQTLQSAYPACNPYNSSCDDKNWVTWDGVPDTVWTYRNNGFNQFCWTRTTQRNGQHLYSNPKFCPSFDSGNFRLKLPSAGKFNWLNQFVPAGAPTWNPIYPQRDDPVVQNCGLQFKASGGCPLRNNTIKVTSDWLGIPAPNNNKKICVYTSGLSNPAALNGKLAIKVTAANSKPIGILKPTYQPVLSGDGKTYQAYCQDLKGRADYKQADIYVEGSEFGMPAGAENAKAIEYWSWPQ